MDNTHGIEPRPEDEGVARPDDLDATTLDPAAESVDGEAIEAAGDASCVEVIGESGNVEDAANTDTEDGTSAETDGIEGEADSEATKDSSGRTELGSPARFNVDFDWLRKAWRAHSLGRVALLAILIYAITSGSAYFFLMQPLSTELHRVKAQKGLLHDYMVIQQASAAIGTFKDGLMTGDQRLTVMSEVKLMAEGSGVTLIGDPDLLLRRDVSGRCVEYPIRLRATGSYHALGEFLSLLESSRRFATVEDVEIRSEVASRSRESEATVLLSLAAWEE